MNSIANVYIGNRKSKLLQFKYDDDKLREKLRNWKCLHSQHSRGDVTDCVVSSLHFMDIITDRKLAEDMAQYLTAYKLGITDNEILIELFKYFGNQHGFSEYDYDESNNIHPYQNWIDTLKRELKKEHLTMVLLKQSTSGHAAIVYKDKKNQLHLIDSQQLTIASLDKDISDYFTNDGYIQMLLIKTPSKRALSPNASTRRKTKISNGQPVKRTTRRSPSPESMSISPEIEMSKNTRKRKRSTALKIRKQNQQLHSPVTKKARYK